MLQTDTHALAKTLNLKPNTFKNVTLRGVFTDTRQRMDGGLFVALTGANFNAHHYAKHAKQMGAVAILASEPVESDLPILYVANTETALAQIAHHHLRTLKPTVIAITGSNGKTTTKNMLANILALHAPTLATSGNFNNHLGVPLTLLQLTPDHQYAVIEMGANHRGEIAHLCRIAPPNLSLITNANNAHLGAFGDVETLVQSKAEIYRALTPDDTAIINNDSEFATQWRDDARTQHCIYFGENTPIFAQNIAPTAQQTRLTLHLSGQQIAVTLQLIGAHHVNNALAAAACAFALGISLDKIKQGLENTQSETGRGELIHCQNLTLINDTYNANPHSMKAAIQTLLTFEGEKIAVLGDMAELGAESVQFHQQIGSLARQSTDALYTYGTLAKDYHGIHFEDLEALAAHITRNHSNATVLIKGSRVANLDKLVAYLQVQTQNTT